MKPQQVKHKHQPLEQAYAILEKKRAQLGDKAFKQLIRIMALEIVEKEYKVKGELKESVN